MSLKILSAIVVPPHLAVSGASKAAEKLSVALQAHDRIDIANMGMASRVPMDLSKPGERIDVRTSSPFAGLDSVLPNRAKTLFYQSSIPALIRHGSYDLVHIHNPIPALEMMRVARACVAKGVPYVVSTHGFVEIGNPAAFRRMDAARRLAWDLLIDRPVRYVVRNAAAICAISPVDLPIVRGFGFTGDDIAVIPYGVDRSNDWGAPTPADQDIHRKFGIPEREEDGGPVTAFFLANHTANKGLGVLLDAFVGLSMPFRLIVGGEKRDFVDYEAYQRRCGPGQTIHLTGNLAEAEVAAMFRRSDLFVLPTLPDTFPNVILEAMAFGVPVVTTRVGGIPHQVDDGCAVIVEPGDPLALRAAVEQLAADPERRARMGRHGRLRATQRFDWAAAAADTHRLYEAVIRRPAGAAVLKAA